MSSALSVVLVAAGSGTRLGSTRPKAFVECAGTTLLEHAVRGIVALEEAVQLVVVAPEQWVPAARDLLTPVVDAPHTLTVVAGGSTRTESSRRGLQAVDSAAEWVLLHDAARCFTPTAVFERVLQSLRAGAEGVIPVMDVVDTVVTRDRSAGTTGSALDRDSLGAVQTPQGFSASTLRRAYEQFDGEATDDAEVVRLLGVEVAFVAGDERSAKITYPHDLERAAQLISGSPVPLVGVGVDAHQFDPAKPLWLGGVHFPGEAGLAGHSDGDVILHAITDALLQAGGLGDLGSRFGVADPQYAGASSLVFLDHTLGWLKEHGLQVSSVSCQYVANSPRLSPRREEMSASLSARVGAPVRLSATTTDGLGFTGRGEGAFAMATALVVPTPGSSAPTK